MLTHVTLSDFMVSHLMAVTSILFSSSLSASSDSAIDKGDNCDYAARVQELEKDLM